jgi:hypothetical protein
MWQHFQPGSSSSMKCFSVKFAGKASMRVERQAYEAARVAEALQIRCSCAESAFVTRACMPMQHVAAGSAQQQ